MFWFLDFFSFFLSSKIWSFPMVWLQENLIFMKKMLKKCSTDQSCIRKRNTTYKIGTLIYLPNSFTLYFVVFGWWLRIFLEIPDLYILYTYLFLFFRQLRNKFFRVPTMWRLKRPIKDSFKVNILLSGSGWPNWCKGVSDLIGPL